MVRGAAIAFRMGQSFTSPIGQAKNLSFFLDDDDVPRQSAAAQATLAKRDELLFLSKLSTKKQEIVYRKRLVETMERAISNSTFFRQRLEQAWELAEAGATTLEIIAAMPITKREDIQKHYASMRTPVPGAKPKDYFDATTSGSTGKAVRVWKHRPELQEFMGAADLLDFYWQKRHPNLDTFATRQKGENVTGIPVGPPFSYLGGSARVTTRKISDYSTLELVDELEKSGARYLFCNGSQLRLLAKEQLRSPRKIKLEQILTWADKTDQELRELAKKAFKTQVADRYSSEELGPIAMQCPKAEHLHVLAPYHHVEVVDEENNPVPEGVAGRVLVTSFANRAMPLFRYELGDLAVLGGSCRKVKWPTVHSIVGRTRDTVIRPDGTEALPLSPIISIRTDPNILDQLILLFDDRVVAVIRPAKPLSSIQEQKVLTELSTAFYLPEGSSELVYGGSGNWTKVWKRKVFERINEPFSEPLVQRIINNYPDI